MDRKRELEPLLDRGDLRVELIAKRRHVRSELRQIRREPLVGRDPVRPLGFERRLLLLKRRPLVLPQRLEVAVRSTTGCQQRPEKNDCGAPC